MVYMKYQFIMSSLFLRILAFKLRFCFGFSTFELFLLGFVVQLVWF